MRVVSPSSKVSQQESNIITSFSQSTIGYHTPVGMTSISNFFNTYFQNYNIPNSYLLQPCMQKVSEIILGNKKLHAYITFSMNLSSSCTYTHSTAKRQVDTFNIEHSERHKAKPCLYIRIYERRHVTPHIHVEI